MSTFPQSEPKDRPARLAVGVVGAGRVGPALAAALQLAGHRPVAVSGVSDASRRRAAQLLPDVPLLSPAQVLERSELVLLTVPDDALPGSSRDSPRPAPSAPASSSCTPPAGTARASSTRSSGRARCRSRCTPR